MAGGNCNDCSNCDCDCPEEVVACEDLGLDLDNSWIYITTETDCKTKVDKVSLRCLKTWLDTAT